MNTSGDVSGTSDGASWIGDSTLDDRFPAWTRGNAADVFPDPFSPLGKSMVLQEGLSPGLRDAYISIGALTYDEFVNPERPDLFKMFGGYVYNPLTMTARARRPHARGLAGDDRQGVLRRARRRPAVRGTAVARLTVGRGQPRRVDGLGDVGRRRCPNSTPTVTSSGRSGPRGPTSRR